MNQFYYFFQTKITDTENENLFFTNFIKIA